MLQIVLLQASYTEGQHHGEERKEPKKKKNQQNQQPLSRPKATSHLFVYGKLCSKRLEQNVWQTQCLQKALGARAAHAAHTQLTLENDPCAAWEHIPHLTVQEQQGFLCLLLALKSDVGPGLQKTLS